MFKRIFLLLFSMFFCISINATHADDVIPVAKKKLPIECTDRENYDMNDCEKARQLEQWTKDQEKVPDDKRFLYAMMGEDLLVEKATGFRIGLHKIKTMQFKDASTAVKIGVPDATMMYAIGGFEGCNRGSVINILKNAPEFTFFYWQCDALRPGRRETQHFDYIIFDKRYNRLDSILSSSHQGKQPTLTLSQGSYKFSWLDYKQSDGSPNPIFYNFKITGNRPEDLKCGRTWNDECDITMIPPLPPSQFKVLDE